MQLAPPRVQQLDVRGAQRVRAPGGLDLEAAAAVLPTADVYLDVAQLFTLGGSGSSQQARGSSTHGSGQSAT